MSSMSTFKNTTIDGKLVINEPTSTPAVWNNGTILITHGTSGGSSSIVFQSRSDQSEYGYIDFDDDRGSGGEANKFTIGTSNDYNDDLYLSPSGSVFVTSGTLYTNSISINGQINGVIKAGSGYGCKAGVNSGNTGHTFNFIWIDPPYSDLQAWIDNVLISGDVCDYRIKENIKPIKPVLDRLCKINMFDFTHKELSIFKPNGNHIGMFAHELQEAFEEYPQLVSGYKDGVYENGELQIQTIDNSILGFILMKSVQEQQTQIQQKQTQLQDLQTIISSLEARLSALDNK
jgi:Chaperone of endosialidase